MPGIVFDHYQRAVALFEAGRLDESLEHFEIFLKERPISGKAWNGAGTVLFRLGQIEKAGRYFMRSLEQQDRPAEAWRNLICTYLVSGKPARAMRLLKTVDHEAHADIALACRTARVFEQQSDPASAMSVLQYGKRLDGDSALLSKEIERLRAGRAKVAFFSGGVCGRDLDAIIEYTQERYPVQVYEGRNPADIDGLMQWCDICWFEGCGDVTAAGTGGEKTCRTIVRLQSGSDERPEAVCWNHVDVLVTTGCPHALRELEERCPGLEAQVPFVTIASGADVEKIAFRRRGRGKEIAVVVTEAGRAGIMSCVSALTKYDGRYQFHYVETAREAVMREDVSYVVSACDTEAARMAVLEAMAGGVKPVVRDFPGAEAIFGKNYLFRTAEEFCGRILEADYDSEAYRLHVEKKCPLSRSLLQIDELFAGFEHGRQGGCAEDAAIQVKEEVSAAV